MRHTETQRYRKRTQRTQAMSTDEICEFSNLNRKQRKIAKRRAKALYESLGSLKGVKLAKNAKLNNKTFTVCQLRALNYTPVYRSISGGSTENLNDNYKYINDRFSLDSMTGKRRKN